MLVQRIANETTAELCQRIGRGGRRGQGGTQTTALLVLVADESRRVLTD
jgi:hypothetical protein